MTGVSPSTEVIISIRGVKKGYRPWYRREHVQALQGIDLDVQRGEIFGFLGPNGAGKTTMVKLLLGLLHLDEGTIQILEGIPGDLSVKARIGYMPEQTLLPTYLRLQEMIALMGSLSGLRGQELKRAVTRVIEAVDLTTVAKRTLDTFSKGMLQRASLAQALVADPDLLLLDEPAIGLDPVGRRDLRMLLCALRDRGKTVFLNSHELEVVQSICDRFAILDHGRILTIEHISSLRKMGKYIIELESIPENIGVVLADLSIEHQWVEARKQLIITAANLKEVNACIDFLRRADLTIASLSPHSLTLEELFLHHVRVNDRRLPPEQSRLMKRDEVE